MFLKGYLVDVVGNGTSLSPASQRKPLTSAREIPSGIQPATDWWCS